MKLSDALAQKALIKFDPNSLKKVRKKKINRAVILDGLSDEYTISSFPGLIKRERINSRCKIGVDGAWFPSPLWFYVQNLTVMEIMISDSRNESKKYDVILAIQEMIDMGADLNIKDEEGRGILLWAVENEIHELVIGFIKLGFNIGELEEESLKDLMITAIKFQKLELLKEIISLRPSIVNSKFIKGRTIFHYALEFENLEAAKLLLESGANPFLLSREGFDHCLLECIKDDLSEFLEEIIKHYPIIGVNYLDRKGRSLLMHAAMYGSLNCIDILLGAAASLDIQDKKGDTALIKAMKYLNIQTAKVLVENGANLFLKNTKGDSALMTLVKQEKRFLLEVIKGNAESIFGFISTDYMEIIDLMLSKSPALLSQTDSEAKTISYYLEVRSHQCSVEEDFLLDDLDLALPEEEQRKFDAMFTDPIIDYRLTLSEGSLIPGFSVAGAPTEPLMHGAQKRERGEAEPQGSVAIRRLI
jgi:ankyrin repeat protein